MGPQPPPHSPPRCTKRNSPPINGQCTNYHIAVLCGFNVAIKGLKKLFSVDWNGDYNWQILVYDVSQQNVCTIITS